MNRKQLTKSKRWIIKVGSALLTNDGQGLDRKLVQSWVDQIVDLNNQGIETILVSSGAVAEGMQRLGWQTRPSSLSELQAAAAVGQMGLIQGYETKFQKHGKHTAQILLTHDDLTDRSRYLNARGTLKTLLELGVVPIVNENDTVVTEEIRFGDNDTLAALVANLVEADVLAILTDQQGLFDADPRSNPDAKLLNEVCAGDPALEAMSSSGKGQFGSGGMLTKVKAAKRAARSGTTTLIAYGREQNILNRLFKGEPLGTLFKATQEPLAARKRWLAGHLKIKGAVTIDGGAIRVLCDSGKSLLPVGVTAVSGDFQRGELIACIDDNGNEIARGLVNYSSSETELILRKNSEQVESILGYISEPELIHRDNLIISS